MYKYIWGMFARLINTIASSFYKTKWTHPIAPRHPDRAMQVPIKQWKIFKGDVVKIRSGASRGKVGKVIRVLRKTNRVVVRGCRMQQYTKRLEDGKTVRIKHSSPIHVSNVGLYDSTINKAVRVLIGYHPDTGEVLRVSKKTGRIFYRNAGLLRKFKREVRAKNRKIGIRDTAASIAHKVTYKGENLQAIRQQFNEFIAAKQAREKLLVFSE